MRNGKIVVLAMLLLAALVFNVHAGGGKDNVIKIGAALALTGDNSAWGLSERNALEMEVKKINAAGGVLGKQIKLISYDTRADVAEAVNVVQRLIDEGVTAIIGPAQSGTAIAATAVTEPNKVAFVATTATNPRVTVDDKTGKVRASAFRACFIDPFQGTVAAQFVFRDLRKRSAAIIYDVGSDYSTWLNNYFAEEFKKFGGVVLAQEAFRTGELDFRAILGKIRPTNPDVLFIPTQQKEASLIMSQAASLGFTCTYIGGDGWATPDLITLGGSAVEGAYLVNIASNEDPDIQDFIKEYKSIYKELPVMPNPVMAIDALYAIIDCIKRTNSTEPATIMVALESVKNLPVLSGILTIDPATHNPLNKPAYIEKIVNGKFVLFKKFVTVSSN